tara:strand:+ start:332 stop:553 length:222 start_codon:yes stop_codon:yes gene_type:complete
MRNTKAIGTFNVTAAIQKQTELFYRRQTNRFGAKGTLSNNQGYIKLLTGKYVRCPKTGKFRKATMADQIKKIA